MNEAYIHGFHFNDFLKNNKEILMKNDISLRLNDFLN